MRFSKAELLLPFTLAGFLAAAPGPPGAGTAEAATLRVPSEYPTLQSAVDAMTDLPDTILVAPGTYQENIDLAVHFDDADVDLVLLSEAGPENTVIDGGGEGSAVRFEPPQSGAREGGSVKVQIDGFTITGARWISTGPTVPVLGAIHLAGVTGGEEIVIAATIVNNTVSENTCAAIYVDGSDAGALVIDDNVVRGNWRGICLVDCEGAVVSNNRVEGNLIGLGGGGIWCEDCAVEIAGNVIDGNRNCDYGAGIHLAGGGPSTIHHNLIVNNEGRSSGGGIYCDDAGLTITHNTIARNSAGCPLAGPDGGGAIRVDACYAITNNVIVNNTALCEAGGIQGCPAVLMCNDLWENTPTFGECSMEDPTNICTDPDFCNPDEDDFALNDSSPCLCAGEGGSDIGAYGQGCVASRSGSETWGRVKAGYR